MRAHGAAVAAVIAAVLAPARPGSAEVSPDRPRVSSRQASRAAELRQRGLEHYLRRDYERASEELMEAYRIDRRPETLLGWGEAVRANGDCVLASRIYERLLVKTSDSKLIEQAEAGIAACADQVRSDASASEDSVSVLDDVEASTPAEPPAPAPAAVPPAPAPRATHATSYLLLGGGSLVALGGLVTYATAADGSARPNATHAEITSARSRGDWYRLIGASITVAGATTALVGIFRYRSESRASASDRRVAVAPYLVPSGGGLALGGRF